MATYENSFDLPPLVLKQVCMCDCVCCKCARSTMKNCGQKYRINWALPRLVETLIMVYGKFTFG